MPMGYQLTKRQPLSPELSQASSTAAMLPYYSELVQHKYHFIAEAGPPGLRKQKEKKNQIGVDLKYFQCLVYFCYLLL